MKREIRLYLFLKLIGIAVKVLPNDATETLQWVLKMPFEKPKNKKQN